MKLKFLSLVTAIFALCLTACTNSGENPSDSHEHSFSTAWTHDETYHWHSSTCGHDVVSDKAEHTFIDTVVNPTFEADGYTKHTCSVCGYFYNDSETQKLPHNYSADWTHDEQTHWHTCIDTGYENLKSGEASHSFVDVVTPPTHETTGYTTHTCSICGYSYVDSETAKLKYTVRFDLDGGISNTCNPVQEVYTFESISFVFDVVKENYSFRGWSLNGTKIFDEKGNKLSNPSLEDGMTFVAVYNQNVNLVITTNMPEAGTISGSGEYPYNSYVDVSAHPYQGYAFVGWYYGNTLLSNTEDYKYMMWSEDITLRAVFKLAAFTLSLKSNNQNNGLVLIKEGNNSDYKPTYTKSIEYTTSVTIAAYSKNDIRFLGWYDTNNNLVETNAVYSFNMPSQDYHLEAKWNYFTINYNLYGGTNNASNPDSYTTESETITLSDPSRDGYEFVGWMYNGNYVTTINPSLMKNITLSAVWNTVEYSITYVLDGGTNDSLNPSTYNTETETIALKGASKTGYLFFGWYTDPEFENGIVKIEKGSIGDITLYAKWTPIDYSITYELNNGTNSPFNPSSYTIESEFTLYNPSKLGYTFQGWYDTNDNKVESISKGTYGNLTLEARWNDGNEYLLTFDPDGGTLDPATMTVQYDHDYSLPTPYKRGYTFTGWYYGSVLIASSGTWKYADGITLKASWEVITYEISYDLNDGGTNSENNPTSYTIEDDIIFEDATPTQDGYHFAGWQNSNGGSISGIEHGTYAEDITIYATWAPNLNSLSVTSENTLRGSVEIVSGSGYTDETITVKATPNGEYRFAGWFSDGYKKSSDSTYSFKMPSHDYSLTARFCTAEELLGKVPYVHEDTMTLTYGLYPQSLVSDEFTITALNNLFASSSPEDNGWYHYEDAYYAKVKSTYGHSTAYSTMEPHTFENGELILDGTDYWFKCEPIVWKIMQQDGGKVKLLSNVSLGSHNFNPLGSGSIINMKNRFGGSAIQSWLNGDFFNTAFNLDSSYITTSSDFDSSYNGTTYTGNVLLPSRTLLETLQDCRCGYSDYSKATCNSQFYNNYGGYWTSTYQGGYQYVIACGANGGFSDISCDNTRLVRPVITLNIS